MFGHVNQRAVIFGCRNGVHTLTIAMNASTPNRHALACARDLCLQVAFGLHHQPRGAEQSIAEQQADACRERKRLDPVEAAAREVPAGDREALHVVAEHDALEERGDERTREERPVPPVAPAVRLQPELEGDAAKDEAEQHQQDRKVERGNDDREGQRKRRHESGAAQDQPRLVAVPYGRDGIHHQRARCVVAREREQDAHAQIEAVEEHVHEHADGEDDGPDRNEVDVHGRIPYTSAADSGRAGRSESLASCASSSVGGPARAMRNR